MEFNVELKCLDTKEVQHMKIFLDDWDSKCVKELKEILEDEIQVPACDQKLYYQGRPLQNDNLFPLKKLYLRKGDTILVECIAQGDLAEIKVLMKDIKDFSNVITSVDQSDLLTVNRTRKDDSSSYVNYDYIARALDQLSFEYFIPWKNAKSLVHRHYFVQEGGFNAFMEVLKFASKRYKTEQKLASRKLFGKSKEQDSEVLAGQLRDLNNEQMILQMHCLSLLWNFSETWHDRRLVMKKGGLPFVIKALLSDPYEYLARSDEYWEVASINETAVGCLVQYAEFPDCQEVIARSPETVSKLMFMVGSQFAGPLESGQFIATYTEYSAQIAANTLFCCACGWQTPKLLVESGMHNRMINLIQLSTRDNLALSYYCTLFLARIRSSALVHLDPHTAKSIDDHIASFLQMYKPVDISRWEEEHNYVWVTMIPFVSLAFSGRKIEAELQNFGLPKCTGECGKPKNAETLLVEQKQTNGLATFLPADQSVVLEKNDKEVESKFDHSGKHASAENKMKDSENSNLPDASGTNFGSQSCVSGEVLCPSTMLGSTQTQQLGLFTVKHILYSNENRQLIERERLLPYLDCLCWHINPDEGRLLRAELTKYWSPSPAHLKIICKSILAFVCGFEAAFKM
ncbi:hypothetical protein ACROYT_G038783 [Oculina patagonica]